MLPASPPKIDNAPGLVWKPRKAGWEARWQARTDLVLRGFTPKSARLWTGTEPSEAERAWIIDRCAALQTEMLVWGRGGIPQASSFTGTLASLIACYETDKDSPYRKLRYKTRGNYDSLTRRIGRDHGGLDLGQIKARDFLRWHEEWTCDGHTAMGHSLMGMLRTLFNFGATILEGEECERLSSVLHKMRFKMGQPRNERITADQASAVRAMAHTMGLHSLALAQAFQFECILRQKDVIGEWVPITEPGVSDVIAGNAKWLRGLRWEEIDGGLILRHVTSKRGKPIEAPLTSAPMVLEEFKRIGTLPNSGPVIVSETTGIPWTAHEFRRQWRKVARACGIPDKVFNMDSRAGAISEATDAGADLEHVRHAATHGDISMTQRYSRAGAEKTANVMRIRAEHRAGKK
jgi:hypothetical protein